MEERGTTAPSYARRFARASKARLISRWGLLSEEVMAEVEDRLRIFLDL
jgi:mRNA-degrading endonuclease toxin of MazEF toxin-antitoxin module